MDENMLISQIDVLINRVDKLIERERAEIETALDAERELDVLFWEVIHKSNGLSSIDESKRGFFRRMDKATGNLRLVQKSITILLIQLDKICRENNINYFLGAGTLLGANRHNGFVPWDDDADVFMLREETEKLLSIIHNYPEFELRSFISGHTDNVCTRILRFAFNDKRIGNWQSFVDIFLLDWCPDTSDETWQKYHEVRTQLNRGYTEGKFESLDSNEICKYLLQKYSKVWNEIVNPGNSRNALCWGFDNFTHGSKYINEYDFVFPLSEVEFEGHMFFAPRFPEKYTRWRYNLWLDIPRSVNSHFHSKIDDKLLLVLKEKLNQYGVDSDD